METLGKDKTSALTDKARVDRERLRSGRRRLSALVALALGVGAGLLLALVVGGAPNGESGSTAIRAIGFGLAGLCAVLMIPAAVRLDPYRPWGAPAAGPCPGCGGTNLREKRITHSFSQGRTTHHYTGVVALCTTCGRGSARCP